MIWGHSRTAYLLHTAALSLLLLGLATSCNDGHNALYQPENSEALQIELQLYQLSDQMELTNQIEPLPFSEPYQLQAPCELRLVSLVSSVNHNGKLSLLNSEEIRGQLKSDHQWIMIHFKDQVRDTIGKNNYFGLSALLDCNYTVDSLQAHFVLIDAKSDTLRDSLTIVALPPVELDTAVQNDSLTAPPLSLLE